MLSNLDKDHRWPEEGHTPMTVTKIFSTAGDYWSEMVEQDYQEHQKDLASLRHALHCAQSLFHMHDWVFHSHEAAVKSGFRFIDSNGNAQPVTNENTFANALEQNNADFGRIRGIANAAKHLKLRDVRPVPHAPSHAANTKSQSTGFGIGGFGLGTFGGSPRVILEGAGGHVLEFSDIAKNVHDMWLSLNATHRWW